MGVERMRFAQLDAGILQKCQDTVAFVAWIAKGHL
jgi:hypothetical protein